MTSDIDRCPHRRPVADLDLDPDSNPDAAECQFLRRLAGVEDGRLCRVERDACASCRAGSGPSEEHLSPTLASLLFDLSSRIGAGGGVAGCDREQAARLRARAEESLFLGCTGPAPETPARRRRVRAPGRSRLGLIGWNTPSGLGALNRDLARHLPIARWLVPTHPSLREVRDEGACPVVRGSGPDDVRDFLSGLDWLLFCEHPYLGPVVPLARALGVRIACVPMWEYLDETSTWLRAVDLMLCPTRSCFELLTRWRERLGLRCALEYVPWPIDAARFAFRPRTVCERFLFVNGTGGARVYDQRTPGWDGRKGIGIIAEAARRAPTVSIVVRSQTADLPPLPANVEVVCDNLNDPARLYEAGDVCVQPSRWEGLGLPLLECQASGLPLITTDAPPMNEHHPFRVLRAAPGKARLTAHRSIEAREVEPAHLAEVLRAVHGTNIEAASLAARRSIETDHSWGRAGPRLLELLR